MLISYIKTIVALVNSMIGSAILILPILFLENGLLLSLVIVIVTGLCACYSNLISLSHMADTEHDFKDTIVRHNKNTSQFPWYVLSIYISTEFIFELYFNLIMKQWTGLLYRVTWILPYLPFITLASIILITLAIKKMHLGVTLMALGVVSVVFAILFYFWVFFSRPEGHRDFPLIKADTPGSLIGLMIQAFCIQNVYVEILRQHPQPKHRTSIICITYLAGALIYFFIGALGGYGLLDRVPIVLGSKTIMGYFYADRWQPFLLQAIYLIHLYSVWPQWAVVNGNRLFQILDTEPAEWKMNLYLILSPCLGFISYQLNVNISTFISLNGGVCLFFALFAIPIYTHVKCRYLHDHQHFKNDEVEEYREEWEEGDAKCEEERQKITPWSKRIDITILVIMSIFACLSLVISVKEAFFGGSHH